MTETDVMTEAGGIRTAIATDAATGTEMAIEVVIVTAVVTGTAINGETATEMTGGTGPSSLRRGSPRQGPPPTGGGM